MSRLEYRSSVFNTLSKRTKRLFVKQQKEEGEEVPQRSNNWVIEGAFEYGDPTILTEKNMNETICPTYDESGYVGNMVESTRKDKNKKGTFLNKLSKRLSFSLPNKPPTKKKPATSSKEDSEVHLSEENEQIFYKIQLNVGTVVSRRRDSKRSSEWRSNESDDVQDKKDADSMNSEVHNDEYIISSSEEENESDSSTSDVDDNNSSYSSSEYDDSLDDEDNNLSDSKSIDQETSDSESTESEGESLSNSMDEEDLVDINLGCRDKKSCPDTNEKDLHHKEYAESYKNPEKEDESEIALKSAINEKIKTEAVSGDPDIINNNNLFSNYVSKQEKVVSNIGSIRMMWRQKEECKESDKYRYSHNFAKSKKLSPWRVNNTFIKIHETEDEKDSIKLSVRPVPKARGIFAKIEKIEQEIEEEMNTCSNNRDESDTENTSDTPDKDEVNEETQDTVYKKRRRRRRKSIEEDNKEKENQIKTTENEDSVERLDFPNIESSTNSEIVFKKRSRNKNIVIKDNKDKVPKKINFVRRRSSVLTMANVFQNREETIRREEELIRNHCPIKEEIHLRSTVGFKSKKPSYEQEISTDDTFIATLLKSSFATDVPDPADAENQTDVSPDKATLTQDQSKTKHKKFREDLITDPFFKHTIQSKTIPDEVKHRLVNEFWILLNDSKISKSIKQPIINKLISDFQIT